jgi:hypothetical protein
MPVEDLPNTFTQASQRQLQLAEFSQAPRLGHVHITLI